MAGMVWWLPLGRQPCGLFAAMADLSRQALGWLRWTSASTSQSKAQGLVLAESPRRC